MGPELLAAFFPVIIDAVKGLIGRFISPEGFRPTNLAEAIKMQELEIEKFKALNEAGGAGATYPWVEAIVRLMRPTVAAVVTLVWASAHVYAVQHPGLDLSLVDSAAATVWFYLFGDRSLLYAKQAGKK